MIHQTCGAIRAMAVCVAAVGLSAAPLADAWAQNKPPAGKQTAWVKLCEKTQLKRATADGKTKDVTKDICLTHHERLDGNTGMVVVSAALRVVDKQERPTVMIMVPLGMAIPPGVKAAVYTKDQWERARNKKKVADKELKPISLKYTLCHPAGCTAEAPAPDGLVKSMQNGGGLMVLALNAAGRPVAFPVPLIGFKEAHAGKPVDSKKYGQARAALMQNIRQKMRERVLKAQTGGRLPEPKPITKN